MELIKNVKEFYAYRELFYNFALRDIKIRYKQTIFGVMWAVIQPFVMMVIFTVVFSRFIRISSDGVPYPVFSYCALVPWTFFANSIPMAANSLIGNISLVTKVYFPREILPFASVAAFLLDFVIAFLILIVLLLVYKIKLSLCLFLFPVFSVILLLFTFSVSLFSSALNVRYRDVKYIIPLGMQIWMYLTPVIYPLSVVPERFRWIYLINPLAGIVHSFRVILLEAKAPGLVMVLYPAAASVILFAIAYSYFKKSEKWFADII